MRCTPGTMKRGIRRILVTVLAVSASPELAFADQWACHVIQTGDTAARVAVHLTGRAEDRHRAWFQIADPAARRFVPKTHYDDIRPGWLACILQQSLTAAASGPRSRRAAITNMRAAALSQIADSLSATPIRPVGLALLFAATLLIWYVVDQYLTDRKAAIAHMARFGEAFIQEFERPLVQPRSSQRALHSQIRVQPDRARVEVLLAPTAGHRYPNLADHRKNVDYDIARVLGMLRGVSVTPGPLQQQGPWVVIPFDFKSRQPQAGVT